MRKIQIKQRRISFIMFVVGLLCLAWVFIELLLRFREHLEPSITFLLAFPLMFSCDAIHISAKDARLFFRALFLVAVILVLMAFLPSSYKGGMLLLYTQNGNQSGLLYMSVFMGVFVYQFLHKHTVIGWAILLGLLYGCWRTESRTSFMVCVMLLLLSLLLWKVPKWNSRVLWISMVVFIALPLLVTTLVEWLGIDVTFMGSSLWTGREEIWPHVIEETLKDPFGMKIDQAVAMQGDTALGAHNVWLDVAWCFSLPVAIMFLIAVFYMGKHMLRTIKGEKASVIAACFSCSLLHMSFEAALISGALDYTLYYLLTLFCGTALLQKENVRK